jgi:hypothetical protein
VKLPPVDPGLAAEVVGGLPRRLRARLDGVVAQAGDWPVEAGPPLRVCLPGGTVTLNVDAGGRVAGSGAAVCDCLLAPRCIHLAAVLTAAPIAAADQDAGTAPSAQAAPPAGAEPLSERGRQAVTLAWRALAELVAGGAGHCTAVDQADLLRAVHLARTESLHLLASALTRVAESLRALRAGDPDYTRAGLAGDLRRALLAAARLHAGGPVTPELRGQARRDYQPVGSLDLAGLLCEPVLTATGYAGVATLLVGGDGRLWSLGSVTPGERDLVRRAYASSAGIGAVSTSHRRLARGGLMIGGATASHDGRLGSPASAQAVDRPGRRWDQDPLAALWAVPLVEQVRRALAAREGGSAAWAGDDLLFLDAQVAGSQGDALLLATPDGATVRATAGQAATTLGARDDLRLLALHRGLPLRVVARLGGGPRAAELLAVGEPPGGPDEATAGRLRLPDDWWGRAFLGLDRLTSSLVRPGSGGAPRPPAVIDEPSPEAPGDRLARWLGRVAVHGRGVLTGADATITADAARLRRAGAPHGAELLEALALAARAGTRRFDGSIVARADPLADAWLRLAVYTDAARRHVAAASWELGSTS